MSDFYTQAQLEETNARVRANMTPAQLELSAMVDAQIQAASQDLDDRFEAESRLRAWAEALCGLKMHISDLEAFQRLCQSQEPGRLFTWPGSSVQLYKTVFGTIDRAESYIRALEATTINVTNASQFTALPFLGLITLAFKRLVTRSK